MDFVQQLHCLVLPQFISLSDFPCLHEWSIRLVLTNSICETTYYCTLLQLSPPKTVFEHLVLEFCHAYAYLSQFRIKCGTETTNFLVFTNVQKKMHPYFGVFKKVSFFWTKFRIFMKMELVLIFKTINILIRQQEN